jgi:hypothetical protein
MVCMGRWNVREKFIHRLSEKKMAIIHKKILTTSGYKPDMKYKPFNHADTKILIFFLFFVSFLAIENFQNHFIFNFEF